MPGDPDARLFVSMQHRFAGGTVLDLSFAAPLPGVVALFGPSGSGKSSLVLCVAGLLRADRSRVRIGDVVLSDERIWLGAERRRIGMVFQDARLFPHLNVAANLRYGARRARMAEREDGAPGFEELVALLGLERLLDRRPRTLSGGERQRVAIGRALLSRPLLLAMDEPLAGLDDERRAEILPYLGRLRERLRLPILYVTHAIDEVIRLADTLVLLREGRVTGCGPVASILGDVQGLLAAREDAACVLDGHVVATEPESGLVKIAAGGFVLRLPAFGRAPGAAVRLKIPAREVMLAAASAADHLPPLSVQNVLAVRVAGLAVDTARGVVTLSLRPDGGGEGLMLAHVTADSARRLALSPGAVALALVKSVSVVVTG
jgi:molybdate transport system ATP-binding protein